MTLFKKAEYKTARLLTPFHVKVLVDRTPFMSHPKKYWYEETKN